MPIYEHSSDKTESFDGSELPVGYKWILNGNTLELHDTTKNKKVLSVDSASTKVSGSLQVALNTLYLEQAHSMSSAGEDVVFKNLQSGYLFNPLWSPVSEDGLHVSDPFYFKWMTDLQEYAPNGSLGTSGIPCEYFSVFPFNAVVFNLKYTVNEPYTGSLSLEVKNQLGGTVFRKVLESNSYAQGDIVEFPTVFLRLFAGENMKISVYKEDGTILNVKSGENPLEPWRNTQVRQFEQRDVLYVDASGKIPMERLPELSSVETGAVDTKTDLYALPTLNKLRIYVVADENRLYLLTSNKDPSVGENWIAGGIVNETVVSFNGRVGAVMPLMGDYTYDMVGALPSPLIDDGLRRVISGKHLMLEPIGTSFADNNPVVPAATSLTHQLHCNLEDLEDRVGPIESNVATLDSTVESLETSVSSLITSVSTINAHLNSLDSSISTIGTHLNSLDTSVASLDTRITTLDNTTPKLLNGKLTDAVMPSSYVTINDYALSSSYVAGNRVYLYGNIYEANGTIAANTSFALGTSGATWKLLSGTAPGIVEDWYGDVLGLSVPSGYWPCNGTTIIAPNSILNGLTAPDLRDKVLAGSSASNVAGSVAGSDSFTLNQNQLPDVTFSQGSVSYTPSGVVAVSADGIHTHGVPSRTGNGGATTITTTTGTSVTNQMSTSATGSHTHPATFTGTPANIALPDINLNGNQTQQSIDRRQSTAYVTKLIKL